MQAALYIRVSTDEQTEYSPSAQRKALIDYAKRNKMTVSEEYIFIDEGKSGKTTQKRPAFMKMIGTAKIKPKPFDVILVHKFDRFSRNREDSIVYKAMLSKECGIKVISITESLNEDDKMSVLIEAMLEAMAEYYSINLAEEVKKGMTERALRGGYQTYAPFGYKMDKTTSILVPNPEEAKIVILIYEQLLDGGKSPYQISRLLYEMGIKTKFGNTMDTRGVEYILQNPVYIGKTHWTPTGRKNRDFNHPDKIIADGQHIPIVTEEMFNKAQEYFMEKKKKSKPKARPTSQCSHWLSGLVKCSNCGSSLTKMSTFFQCRGYGSGKCYTSHGISIVRLEKRILEELNKALENTEDLIFERNLARIDTAQDEIDLLKKKIEKLNEKFQRMKTAYYEHIDSLEEYKENRTNIEKQRESIKTEIERLEKNQPQITQEFFSERINNLTELLKSDIIDMDTKLKAIRKVIQKIVYCKADESLTIYYFNN